MSRYPRRRAPKRLLTSPWTEDDTAIVEHLPDWQRADYKLSDRFDADTALTSLIGGRYGQVTATNMETHGPPVSSSGSDRSSELPAAPPP